MADYWWYRRWFLMAAWCLCVGMAPRAGAADGSDTPDAEYRLINAPGEPYRTPLAGEGFRANIFGRQVEVPVRERRALRAVSLGYSTSFRDGSHHKSTPHGALYLWRHPDADSLLRAVIAGVYNDVFYAHSPRYAGRYEWQTTWENMTVPEDRAPWCGGRYVYDEELEWGYARLGLGVGYRQQIRPGNQENMFSVGLSLEPGVLYFDRGDGTAGTFVVPRDTFEGRVRLRVRADALQRNVMELPHLGTACGSDVILAYRDDWDAWGLPDPDGRLTAAGRHYSLITAYGLAAAPVPFVDSEQHRLVGSLLAGVGDGVDRFSAQRVGGGPWPQGQEYGSTSRPVCMGAILDEFVSDRYCIGAASYRWEPLFFIHLSLDAALAYVDDTHRDHQTSHVESKLMRALGTRLTTGFIGHSRLQVGYAYNFDVRLDGVSGGHALVTQVSKRF